MKPKHGFCLLLLPVLFLTFISCGSTPQGPPDAPAKVADADYKTMAGGLKVYDFKEGTGSSPQQGQTVVVHYTGWLTDGRMFDSSLRKGNPFSFVLGAGQVIQGWDIGVATMKAGGRRQLVVPYELGYGEAGHPAGIPPRATLIFEVDLLEIK